MTSFVFLLIIPKNDKALRSVDDAARSISAVSEDAQDPLTKLCVLGYCIGDLPLQCKQFDGAMTPRQSSIDLSGPRKLWPKGLRGCRELLVLLLGFCHGLRGRLGILGTLAVQEATPWQWRTGQDTVRTGP